MLPKNKAKKLVELMYTQQWREGDVEFHRAKQCAMIVCDEFIAEMKGKHIGDGKISMDIYRNHKLTFWKSVKEEIKLLKQEEKWN